MNTGYIIKQYIDINPLSPTYNQTWTERVLDTDHCPQSADDWVEIANYCEIVASGYTGNRQIMYYSDSLNAYSSVTRPDTSCTPSSSEEQWVNDGEPYCEQVDGKNTGYMIQKQIQKNINLVNYGETREMKYQSDECGEPTPTGDTCPHWQEIMRYCNIINDSGTTLMDGTSNVAQIDNNPNSSRYNETRTINVYDSGCSNMVGATFEWVEIGDYCGDSGILCDEGTPMVKTTLYTVYRRRKTINGITTNMDELSAVTKEIGSQSCGADVRRQWIRTDDTECVNETPQIKAILTLNDGSIVEIPGNGELTSNETSGYSATCVSAEITTACTGIGNSAFNSFSGLTSVTIPDTVTSIGGNAFSNCNSLDSISIPSGVTRIGRNAFSHCTSLTSVTIPSGVTSIDYGTFYGCSGLTNVAIESGITSIGNQAFMLCSSLTSVTIPDSVTTIGTSTFRSCSGLTSVTIGSGVTSIGSSAFDRCSSLTSVTIPDTVTSIGDNAFRECTGLTSVTIGSGATNIGRNAFNACTSLTSINIPSGVTSIDRSTFEKCTSLTGITIPDSVTSIGNRAFRNCSSLASVTIPSGVTSIAEGAFDYCSGLTEITVEAITPPTISGSSIFYRTNNCPIYVPCESVDAYKTAWPQYESRIQCKEEPFEGKAKLTLSDGSTVIIPGSGELTVEETRDYYDTTIAVEIGSACTSLGDNALSYHYGITSIIIPDNITSIGNSAFEACSGLTSATIGSGVTSIGGAAFRYCSGLTSVAIGNSVTSIGRSAFYKCFGLTSVTIPSGVTSIGSDAFMDCSGLTSITVEATTPPTLGDSVVFYNTNNCPIYVPAASVDTYKAATNWSRYASRITAIP